MALAPLALAGQSSQDQTRGHNQEKGDQESYGDMGAQKSSSSQRLVKMSTIKNLEVTNRTMADGEMQNDKVADLADLILDPRSGHVRYALLSRGGVGGIGDTLIAVPIDQLSTEWDREDMESDELPEVKLHTDLSGDRLAKAPEFNQDDWDKGGRAWQNDVDNYFGSSTAKDMGGTTGKGDGANKDGYQDRGNQQTGQDSGVQEASMGKAHLMRLSKLMGADLHDSAGEKIASVENIVLNPNTMSVAFVVVGSGGVLGIGEELRAIPLKAIHHQRTEDGEDRCMTALTNQQLESAPIADPDQWDSQGTVAFADRVKREVMVPDSQSGYKSDHEGSKTDRQGSKMGG